MKIPQSIRNIYQELEPSYLELKQAVDNEFRNTLPQEWHYVSRVKKAESFAIKIESGRYKSIDTFDDFFACTIVVENISKIKKAKKFIEDRLEMSHQRPKAAHFTHKSPESFPFDDLRLYVKWKDKSGNRPSGLDGILFEVQIKTFLQHAWSIATHDLVYKSDEQNWAKERIAYQVKAMLEHAEVSINEADQLSKSSSIKKINFETKQIKKIINVLKEMWPTVALPQNLKLLAINLKNILNELGLSPKNLKEILEKDTEENLGVKALNLSPFGIVVQALFNQQGDKMNTLLSSDGNRVSVFIHQEVNIPKSIDSSKFKNYVSYTH
jgi:ppGpp synthetase/RelA/SpoT-type nucleotidyltranferase